MPNPDAKELAKQLETKAEQIAALCGELAIIVALNIEHNAADLRKVQKHLAKIAADASDTAHTIHIFLDVHQTAKPQDSPSPDTNSSMP